jgi:hypothetical protein
MSGKFDAGVGVAVRSHQIKGLSTMHLETIGSARAIPDCAQRGISCGSRCLERSQFPEGWRPLDLVGVFSVGQ